ncbi:MAG: LysE family translocator [Desulfobacterales bacterium]|nr:LysE family translocator [Desulfobacterales bacterium]
MFEYSLAHWTTFLSAAILLNLSPGPDMMFILGQTAKRGVASGFSAMFGIWTGALVHVLFAALGLSAVLATSATAFSFVKWAGAAYLIWLGIQALRSEGSIGQASEFSKSKGPAGVFRQGVMVSVLNPKVAVFFLAFLPQFVEPGAGPAAAQLFFHGIIIILVAALVEPPLILMGGKIRDGLSRNNALACWIDRGIGTLFIGLGIKLAVSNR